jgi:hypothetical protein
LYKFSFSELLELANAFCEVALKWKCERIIKSGTTVENAAVFYSTAVAYKAQVRIRYSSVKIDFISNMLCDMLLSYSILK